MLRKSCEFQLRDWAAIERPDKREKTLSDPWLLSTLHFPSKAENIRLVGMVRTNMRTYRRWQKILPKLDKVPRRAPEL